MLLPLEDGVSCWAVFFTALFLFYRYLTKNYNYWDKQNVPFVKPRMILGSFSFFRKPLHETELELYKKYGRIYGRFDGSTAVLSVAEPELLKRILLKHFNVFPNHRDLRFNDPLMDNTLFALEGEAWRRVRNTVSPAFTGSKLKKMLALIEDCSDTLIKSLEKAVEEREDIDCQKTFGAFTVGVIGRCAFGMKITSLLSDDDPFVENAKMLLQCLFSWRTVMTMLFPKVMKLFRISLLNPQTTQFYKNIVVKLVEQRKQEKEQRRDFLQLVLDAEKEKPDLNNNCTSQQTTYSSPPADNNHSETQQNVTKGLSHDEFLAQCVTFFMAGYDSTTSLFSYALYNLATHEDCQQRLQQEIDEALSRHGNSFSYDALSEMKYFDAVISETLRLCPPAIRADRRAETDYLLGDTGIEIKKDMLVSIPIYAIHRDPEWYPQPDYFVPERFMSPKTAPPAYTYLAFGAGPRLCLGMRFAQMQVKMCLAKILSSFQVQITEATQVPLGYTESRGILKANNVKVRLTRRQRQQT